MAGYCRITGAWAAIRQLARSPARVGRSRVAMGAVLAAFVAALSCPALASDGPKGSVTGLPLPRYVSLKSDRVNLRGGPNKDHATHWVYQRVGLPVEITAEFETWRRVRDSEGVEGWVLHSLLSGKRTALIAPWEKAEFVPLLRGAQDDAPLAARLEPGVIVQVKKCDKTWCEVAVARREGYVRQEKLWGVYPGEIVD